MIARNRMLRNSALCVKQSAFKIQRKQEFAGYGKTPGGKKIPSATKQAPEKLAE
jgi:hypothetical protein